MIYRGAITPDFHVDDERVLPSPTQMLLFRDGPKRRTEIAPVGIEIRLIGEARRGVNYPRPSQGSLPPLCLPHVDVRSCAQSRFFISYPPLCPALFARRAVRGDKSAAIANVNRYERGRSETKYTDVNIQRGLRGRVRRGRAGGAAGTPRGECVERAKRARKRAALLHLTSARRYGRIAPHAVRHTGGGRRMERPNVSYGRNFERTAYYHGRLAINAARRGAAGIVVVTIVAEFTAAKIRSSLCRARVRATFRRDRERFPPREKEYRRRRRENRERAATRFSRSSR